MWYPLFSVIAHFCCLVFCYPVFHVSFSLLSCLLSCFFVAYVCHLASRVLILSNVCHLVSCMLYCLSCLIVSHVCRLISHVYDLVCFVSVILMNVYCLVLRESDLILHVTCCLVCLQTTEDDHADKAELLASINAMTDVATAINEYKRRKDLGK